MPVFRCAYCHEGLGEEPPRGPCPSCGRRMLVPEELRRVPFRERQKTSMRRGTEAGREPSKTSVADAAQAMTRNNATFIFIALGLFLVVGSALVGRSSAAAKIQIGPIRKQMAATRELAALYGGIEGFKVDCGAYPAESNGLRALVLRLDNPKWDGPYVNVLKSDPWRHPYFYRLVGTGFVVKSLGPDGIESEDDIAGGANWSNLVEFAPKPQVAPSQ